MDGRVVVVACADQDAREICRACLAHAGYAVHVAGRADEALALARSARPHLIVTSSPTHPSRGHALTRLVRADPALADVPVLNLASWVRPEELAAAAAAGVSVSLTMPVDLVTLVATVDRLVRRPQAGRGDRPTARRSAHE
jgi:CheY-like chemotaxis protein